MISSLPEKCYCGGIIHEQETGAYCSTCGNMWYYFGDCQPNTEYGKRLQYERNKRVLANDSVGRRGNVNI